MISAAKRYFENPNPEPRGWFRLSIIAIAVLLSPPAGIIYAGVTYNRLIKYLTYAIIAALIITTQYVALYGDPFTGNTLTGFNPFLKEEAISISLVIDCLTAAVLTQIEPPRPDADKLARKHNLQRNGFLLIAALITSLASDYGIHGYLVESHGIFETQLAAQKAYVSAMKHIPATDTQTQRLEAMRMATMTYDKDFGRPAPIYVLNEKLYMDYIHNSQLCKIATALSPQYCAIVKATEKTLPIKHGSKIEALKQMLSPENALAF